jgi:hypothetical protein
VGPLVRGRMYEATAVRSSASTHNKRPRRLPFGSPATPVNIVGLCSISMRRSSPLRASRSRGRTLQ